MNGSTSDVDPIEDCAHGERTGNVRKALRQTNGLVRHVLVVIEGTGWGGLRLPHLANSSTEPGESREALPTQNASYRAARGAWHLSLHSSPTNGPESEKGYRME